MDDEVESPMRSLSQQTFWRRRPRSERDQLAGGSGTGVPSIFQPREETIERMMDMGFGRNNAIHAIESSHSNDVEVAMEYALSHQGGSVNQNLSSSSNNVNVAGNNEIVDATSAMETGSGSIDDLTAVGEQLNTNT